MINIKHEDVDWEMLPEGANAFVTTTDYNDFALVDDLLNVTPMPAKSCFWTFSRGGCINVTFKPNEPLYIVTKGIPTTEENGL